MVKIVVDSREPDVIAALLVQLGVEVERRVVTPGDYILSSDCAVERKTTQDFFNSLISGRLFDQVERLKEAYAKPLLIIEGDVGEELANRLNPRAFWGALLKLQMDYNLPTINTYNTFQTVDLLVTLAKRLQQQSAEHIKLRHKPKILTERERQIYVVCGLPDIGEGLAIKLLSHFGSVRKVFSASKFELMDVEGIGEVKAERITKLLDAPFKEGDETAERMP
jgi:ERCC4-type nuclease